MLDFNKCRPIELDDLIRVGNEYDGGYILSKRQIEETETVLSFGIDLDWTFEEDFFYNKNVKIYSYDYSTKAHLEKNIFGIIYRFFHSSAAIMYFLMRGKPGRVKKHLRRIRLKSNFYKFFNGKQGKHYIPKFIGNCDDKIYTCFDTIFNKLGNINNLSVFVKMDIEGAEYETLPRIMRYLGKINGMAIEFHNLIKYEKQFIKLLDKLREEFYIAHVHGCNFDRLIKNTNIPNIMEMTFINKKIVSGNITPSKKNYPIEGLDFPCYPFKEDYVLQFC